LLVCRWGDGRGALVYAIIVSVGAFVHTLVVFFVSESASRRTVHVIGAFFVCAVEQTVRFLIGKAST